MPYAPTNLYPRNITLEERNSLLFLGDIDKSDTIEDVHIELINNTGKVDAVICPKDSDIKYRQNDMGEDTWINIPYVGNSTSLPIKGYQSNNIQVEIDSKSMYSQATGKLAYNSASINYTYDDQQNSTYFITLNFTYDTDYNIALTFEYDRKSSRQNIFYYGLDDYVNSESWDLIWRSQKANVNISSSNPKITTFPKVSISLLNTSDLQQYAKRKGQGSYPLLYKFNESKLEIDLQKLRIFIDDQDWYFEFSLNKKWNTTTEGEQYKGIVNSLYRFKQKSFKLNTTPEATTITKDIKIYLSEGARIASWENLKQDFSWRFLLFGKYYDNLIYQGSWEKVQESYPEYRKTDSNVIKGMRFGDFYFTPPNDAQYKYIYDSYGAHNNGSMCHKIIAEPKQANSNLSNYTLYIGGFYTHNTISKDTSVGTETFLGTVVGSFQGLDGKDGGFYVKKIGSDFTGDEIKTYTSKSYTAHLLKINGLVNCPFYMYDKNSNTYYAQSPMLKSFSFGENCRVSQTYSNNKYSYIIEFSDKLNKLLGKINIDLGVKYYIGGTEITTESLTKSLDSNTITFNSDTPYIVAQQTITQIVYCQIERSEDYLKPVSKEFMSNRDNLFFRDLKNRTLPADWNFVYDDIAFPPEGSNIALYTNEFYSLENKYTTVNPLNDLQIKAFHQNIWNAIHLVSNENERLLSYKILVYNNNKKIYESKEYYSKVIDYWYKNVETNKAYEFEIQVITTEGLKKKYYITKENIFDEKNILTKEINDIYNNYTAFPLEYFTQFKIPALLEPFYLQLSLNISVWKDSKNQIFNKEVDSFINNFDKILFYNMSKDYDSLYRFASQKEVMIKQSKDSEFYCSQEWSEGEEEYKLTMQDDDFIIIHQSNTYNLTTEDCFNNNILEFKNAAKDESIYIDTINKKWTTNLNNEWKNMSDLHTNSITTSSLKEKEIIQINFNPCQTNLIKYAEWITPALFGTKTNPEENDENIYEVNPEQIWYFNLDTKADNIDFTNNHGVLETLSQYPQVGLSNTNYMTQSITTKLGYLNEDDMYVGDNGEKLSKFAKFANDGTVKILRLPNGYLIPVDIQLTNNTTQYNLVGEPSDITFKWTQIADHETCVLYGWE